MIFPVSPDDVRIDRKGIFRSDGKKALGIHEKLKDAAGNYTFNSRMYISEGAFSSIKRLYLTMGHELNHTLHWYHLGPEYLDNIKGIGGFDYLSEYTAHSWVWKAGDSIGFNVTDSYNYLRQPQYMNIKSYSNELLRFKNYSLPFNTNL